MARLERVPARTGHEPSPTRRAGQNDSGNSPALQSFDHNEQLCEVSTERCFRRNAKIGSNMHPICTSVGLGPNTMSRNMQKTNKKLVGLEGFEPPTHGLGNRCSIHLSYRPSITYKNSARKFPPNFPHSFPFSDNLNVILAVFI